MAEHAILRPWGVFQPLGLSRSSKGLRSVEPHPEGRVPFALKPNLGEGGLSSEHLFEP